MNNVSPPPPKTRLWTWAPWLAVLAAGVCVHAYVPAQPPTVHVIPIPTPPTVVTVDSSTDEVSETFEVTDDTTSQGCERRRERRKHRKRRHRSRSSAAEPAPSIDVECHLKRHWVCTVDRQDALGLTPERLTHSARIVPSKKDGQIVGLKLYGIREGSLLHALQFRNGDLVVDIGGVPITDHDRVIEHVLDLKAELEHGPLQFDVQVVRKGVRLAQTLKFE